MPGMKSIPLREVLQILENFSPKYAALAAIGVTTGCRISELLSLKHADLLDNNGNIRDRVKFVKLKSKKENTQFRQLIIPADFQSYILRHLQAERQKGYELNTDWVFRGAKNRPLNRQAVYLTFRQTLGNGYGTHWMRKTFAQELYKFFLQENPNDSLRALDLTRQALGHSKIDTTIKYLGIEYSLIDNAQKSIFAMERIKNGF